MTKATRNRPIRNWSLATECVHTTEIGHLTSINVVILTFCFDVRCTSLAALLVALHRSGNPGVCHTGPFEPAAPVHLRARHPWRPWRPRRPVCRGIAQRRNPYFLSCSGLWECRRPQPDHISRIHV